MGGNYFEGAIFTEGEDGVVGAGRARLSSAPLPGGDRRPCERVKDRDGPST